MVSFTKNILPLKLNDWPSAIDFNYYRGHNWGVSAIQYYTSKLNMNSTIPYTFTVFKAITTYGRGTQSTSKFYQSVISHFKFALQ